MENLTYKKVKHSFPILFSLLILGCTYGETSTMQDKSLEICNDKPNCVSTLDHRKKFHLTPFELVNQNITMEQIVKVALTLPGARLATETSDYARIECLSRVMKFVDELEIRHQGSQLVIRSESRTGYYDFGVNRKRAEQLRAALVGAGYIKGN